jgi:hypothetical protein
VVLVVSDVAPPPGLQHGRSAPAMDLLNPLCRLGMCSVQATYVCGLDPDDSPVCKNASVIVNDELRC